MKHQLDTPESDMIMAGCPICGATVPFAHVSVNVTGLWRPHVRVTVDGDATDFVTHLWSHRSDDWK